MARTSCSFFLAIFTIGSLFGVLSTAPTTNRTTEHWNDPIAELKPATTTTPAPEKDELLCERKIEMFDKNITNVMKQTITKLMGEYNDWGKLLAPAPIAIGILGQLILLAHQVKDFSIHNRKPNQGYEYIKYPNSFRTTLLQVSQSGYNSFLKAHRNMDAIRLYNDAVPSDIKDAIRYLVTEDERLIGLRLPGILERIQVATEKSQELAKEVVDEFSSVLSLIDETALAVGSTKSINEKILENANFSIQLNNQSREMSENESSVLMKKEIQMKNLMARLEKSKGRVSIMKGYDSVTQQYTSINNFIDSNFCAQNNSDQLLDLLIAFKQYRTRWPNLLIKKKKLPFQTSKLIETLEHVFKNFKNCTEIYSIIKQGKDLMKKIKTFNSTKPKNHINKKASLPFETEINEITIAIHHLRKEAQNATQTTSKQVKLLTNGSWKLYGVSKRDQLDKLNIMSKTIEDILNFNNEIIKIRRQKTQLILDRLSSLNITKVNTENVIEILRQGMEELGCIKNHWGELIRFFDKIRHFVVSASRHSEGFVEIVESLSKNPSDNMKDKNLLSDMRNNFEKSNEAVLLVHGIAEMYVNVSNLYIMDRLVKLNTMNSMGIKGATKKQLEEIKENIITESTEASNGIEAYIKNHEKQLNEELQTRHKGIFNEYQKVFDCIRKHGITDFAVNFTGATSWFRIQSKMNGNKVIEVSSKNPSNVVQLWESHGGDNQLWYFDEEDVIRSMTTGFCLNSNRINRVTVEPCQDNEANQKWTIENDMIVNRDEPNRGLNIYNLENINGAFIIEIEIDQTSSNDLWEMV